MSFKAKVHFDKLRAINAKFKGIKSPVDKATAAQVGVEVIEAMKALIAKGSSPIEGKGKFPAYKDPDRYPGKRKPKRPVNLKLTGKFLDSLRAKVYQSRSGFGTEIGYLQSQQHKEQGHREGANGQPKRPSLPSARGENFVESIVKIFSRIYKNKVREVTKK
jgi:hypothetical protein